jgi:uncharacterized protein
MGTILRLLLFAFAVYLLLSGIRRLLLPTSLPRRSRSSTRQGPQDEVMVQDPQCGKFVTEREAFPASVHGQTVYFCSRECRNLYTHSASQHQ